jgi:hypothetical protein
MGVRMLAKIFNPKPLLTVSQPLYLATPLREWLLNR